MLGDLRRGLRAAARRPWFSAAVVAILALAIGANTAVFALVNAVFLRPIPGVAEPSRVVNVHHTTPANASASFSHPDYRDLREAVATAADLAAFNGRGMTLGAGGQTDLVGGQLLSGNYFRVVGTRAHLGRLLEEADDGAPGAAPVVVISHGLWQRRFGSDAEVVGRAVRVNGHPFTVVGVTEPGFQGHFTGFPFDVFVPLAMAAQAAPNETLAARDSLWLEAVARLAPGVSPAAAQAALSASMDALARAHPDLGAGRGVHASPLTGLDDELLNPVRGFLALLQALAAAVLVAACLNVAGLLLARAAAGTRETAVRVAIGARRGDLLRAQVAEVLPLLALGAAGGLLLARWASHRMMEFQPRFSLPLRLDLGLDGRVVAFAFLAAALAGAAACASPVLAAARLDVITALKEGGGLGISIRAGLRRAFVVGQVALSMALLVVAGLFLRSLDRAKALDPGFAVDEVHTLRADQSVLGRSPAQRRVFYDHLLERARALPGVEGAALARRTPMSLGSLGAFVKVEGVDSPAREGFLVDLNEVSPGFFETLRIPLRRGRDFDERDGEGAPRVAIVNEAFVRRFWPAAVAEARRLQLGGEWAEVVGVVADHATRRLGEAPAPQVYLPARQRAGAAMALFVRAGGDHGGLASRLREVVRALEPDLPLLANVPLREAASFALAPQRLLATAASVLAGLSLVLSAAGLYAVVAFFVGQRTREIGLRMALGARADQAAALVLREGLKLAAVGAGAGLAVAAAAAPALRRFLAGLGAADPAAFVAGPLVVLAVAAAACLGPARRAARLDPLVALRSE
jgi:predicted permease